MKRILSLLFLLAFSVQAQAANIKYSALTSGGTVKTSDIFPVLRVLTVSGAADNGSGLIRLTTATNTGLGIATNDLMSVSGVVGTTEANGQWAVTVINATHLDLQGSTFTNAYVSGGQVNFNPSVAVNTLATLSAAPAGTLTGTTLNSTVVTSSLTSLGTIGTGVWNGTAIDNTYILHPSTTVNGQVCTLGSTCTAAAAAGTLTGNALPVGVTASSLTSVGAGIALGTPASGVATNLTGTAASLTAGTATNAVNTGITEDTTTNATMYPTWVTANTGNLPQKTTSTKLSFNPSSGVLSSTSFTGAGTGLTGTASSLTAGLVTNGIYTTDTGTVTNTMLAGSVALTKLATQATNTVVGNATSGSAAPTALAVGTCSTAGSALNWTTNTGFGCNTSITAAAVPASGLTGTSLPVGITASSLTSTGTLTGGATGAGFTVALGTSTLTGTVGASNIANNELISTIGATFTNGGSTLVNTQKTWVYVPWAGTINSNTIVCDQSGSVVFDIKTSSYAGFPGSLTSIVASAAPTVASAQNSQDATLTGWTTSVTAGTVFQFSVTSATTVTNCTIVLKATRT